MGDSGFSLGMLLGAIAGIGIGTSIGIAIGGKQKPWSELTDSEKRTRIMYIAAGSIIFVVGVVILIVRLLTQ